MYELIFEVYCIYSALVQFTAISERFIFTKKYSDVTVFLQFYKTQYNIFH